MSDLVTTRRFTEGAKIGAMAKFIQQEHSLAQVLAEFEQQVVAAGRIKPIQFRQVRNRCSYSFNIYLSQNGPISADKFRCIIMIS